MKKITVTNKNINYTNLADMVEFAVERSFDKNGRHHKYLQDYAEALTLLAVMTDYDTESKDITDSYNEVMEIANSDEWANEIVPEFGNMYSLFIEYVDSEIENRLRPMSKFDDTLDSLKKLVDMVIGIVDSVDTEALKNIDVTQLANALERLNVKENKLTANNETENNTNTDNVVTMRSVKDGK